MSIHFQCEECGHPIDVDDRFGGKHGKCKHCGHPLIVPRPHQTTDAREPVSGPGLRLRPLEGEEPAGAAGHLLAAQAPLKVRPAEAEPRAKPAAISDPDETRGRKADDYSVLDPHHLTRHHSSAGPPPFWRILPSMTARLIASYFRQIRDWLYVVSVAFLVLALLGYLFQWKVLLHLGIVGVVASNISMLCVGVAYLVTLPFKESLFCGLANLFIPFYAIYYWTTHWTKMRTPVYKTLGSFVPILLVGLAYFAYEEAPVVEHAIESGLPRVEQSLEKKVPVMEKRVDDALGPLGPGLQRLEKSAEGASRDGGPPAP